METQRLLFPTVTKFILVIRQRYFSCSKQPPFFQHQSNQAVPSQVATHGSTYLQCRTGTLEWDVQRLGELGN